MSKTWMILSFFLNITLALWVYDLHTCSINTENLCHNYQAHYVPKELLDRAKDKISGYEWIFRNILKCENVDTMRIYWCGR